MRRMGVSRVIITVLYLAGGPGARGRSLFTELWQIAPGSHQQFLHGPLVAGLDVSGVGGQLLLGLT